ncbi:MAG: helix-turn-helix domain-containing protein [Lentisphaeria bacterium]|nr:helix-turn-helix domain-containing protein [Lentisphaeria bacterium]
MSESAVPQKELCDFSILRDLRKREKMSLEELSLRSGVSVSVISKLERNNNNAEMETLYRLAKVFGMTLSDFIALAENRISHLVDEEHYRSGSFTFRRVSYGNMRCMYARAEAGAMVSTPELHRDDYEMCWVLKGKLRFSLPKENYELTAGMSIQFDALLPHTFEALEDLEMILVHLRKGKRF